MKSLFRSQRPLFCLPLLLSSLAIAGEFKPDVSLPTNSTEWPQWRGVRRDGISDETGLLKEWKEEGPPLLWRSKGLGRGYSSVAIAQGKIFTMGQRNKGAFLIAVKLEDGSEVWSAPVGDGDPNCTPTVDGDLVYCLGRKGDLVCAKTATGEEVWRKNYGQDFGGKMMSGWGYSESPLVDGDRLICTPGAPDAMLAALNKRTGETIWKASMPTDVGRSGGDGAAYSSIVVSQGAGVKQYIQLVGRGLISVRADDGETLWTYNRIANGTANIPTPLVKGDYVFTSSGYGGGGSALLKLNRTGENPGVALEEVYYKRSNELQNHHGGMVLLGDYIYFGHGHNNGFPVCVELATGNTTWAPGRGPGSGSAAVAYADGHMYFRYDNGIMALIEATPKDYVVKGQFKLAAVNGKSWPHPVISGGKLYLRDQDELMCYDLRN